MMEPTWEHHDLTVSWEEEKITTYGPSGIGFVNFGIMSELRVNAPIETFGQGARGGWRLRQNLMG
ncbi:MAG: hypothetical protein ACRDG4_20315 [Chloroflexota bacterium]